MVPLPVPTDISVAWQPMLTHHAHDGRIAGGQHHQGKPEGEHEHDYSVALFVQLVQKWSSEHSRNYFTYILVMFLEETRNFEFKSSSNILYCKMIIQ